MSRSPAAPRILYLSRDGILDGLGESQILGYLRALARDHRFWLVTFEKSLAGTEPLRESLAAAGIEWRALKFRGSGSPLRAGFGLVTLVLLSAWLVVSRRIRIVHARSYLPCAVALAVRAICLGYPRIVFDMRGFWVDERAEAGRWSRHGVAYRSGKRVERRLLRGATEIVTLTGPARTEAVRLLGPARPRAITVIPTCVDTERFRPRPEVGPAGPVASRWCNRLAFIYVGAAGFWQDPETLAEFFAVVHQERADAVFLCLLRTGSAPMRRALANVGLAAVSQVEEAVPWRELPRWLAIASAGVVWYRPSFSRIGNFPTKLGEYLACGLPVVVGGATADSVELVARERVGTVVTDFSIEAYREAITAVLGLATSPDTAARCRETAERYLSVRVGAGRYAEIYRRLWRRAA